MASALFSGLLLLKIPKFDILLSHVSFSSHFGNLVVGCFLLNKARQAKWKWKSRNQNDKKTNTKSPKFLMSMSMIIWIRYKLKLKIPDHTKHPSTPSCISREQSAGVANPPAAKFTTGSRPKRAVSFKRSRGAWNLTTFFLDFATWTNLQKTWCLWYILAMSMYFCMTCNCTMCNLLLLGKLHTLQVILR